MPLICQNCSSENIEGTLFCVECGAQIFSGGIDTVSISTRERKNSLFQDNTSEQWENEHSSLQVSKAFVSMHLINTGQILPLMGKAEYIIGRVSSGQSILPDIDLTAYDAYKQGISRLHATIKINSDSQLDREITIIDLGSANGTRVNNVKISPHTSQKIKDGDVVTLGRFKFQLLVRETEGLEKGN